MKLKLPTFIVMCVLALSACTTNNQKFHMVLSSGLHVGMSEEEVAIFINELRKDTNRFVATGFDTIGSECVMYESLCRNGPDSSVLRLYSPSHYRYPYDVLKSVTNGTPYRYVEYWGSPNHHSFLYLFFDEKTKRLKGWVRDTTRELREPFMHERLTSKLGFSGDNRLTRTQVYALIGPPNAIVKTEPESRATYEDHFWSLKGPIASDSAKQMEVYSYPLPSGATRKVYIAYRDRKGDIMAWGYDHAWEEAERYLREKSQH